MFRKRLNRSNFLSLEWCQLGTETHRRIQSIMLGAKPPLSSPNSTLFPIPSFSFLHFHFCVTTFGPSLSIHHSFNALISSLLFLSHKIMFRRMRKKLPACAGGWSPVTKRSFCAWTCQKVKSNVTNVWLRILYLQFSTALKWAQPFGTWEPRWGARPPFLWP